MKTSNAVLLSTALTLALVAVLGGLMLGGFWWLKRTMQGPPPVAPSSSAAPAAKVPVQADAVLAPYRQRLDATRKPVAQLRLQPVAQDDRLVSKVGGRTYWTADQAYPRDAHGQPLALLAQVDLATLPPLRGYPTRGLLQFFIGSDDFYGANLDGASDLAALSAQRNFRVVYWPRPQASARQAAVPLPSGDALPFDPAHPRAMHFAVGAETIGRSDVHFAQALGRPLGRGRRRLRRPPCAAAGRRGRGAVRRIESQRAQARRLPGVHPAGSAQAAGSAGAAAAAGQRRRHDVGRQRYRQFLHRSGRPAARRFQPGRLHLGLRLTQRHARACDVPGCLARRLTPRA
jgi:hypothetical protein